MGYPRVIVDLKKIQENLNYLLKKSEKLGIEVIGVTKVFSGSTEIAETLVKSGVKYLGDSRIENLKNFSDLDVKKVMIRLPMVSQAKEVVKYSDISLNSELETISRLNQEASKQDKVHGIILMMELGDLREGILEENVEYYVEKILEMKNIKLEGIGVNLTCYGGVIPSEKNIGRLEELGKFIENKYEVKLNIISGGNSSSIEMLLKEKLPSKINNLRLGEAIFFGRESAYGKDLEGCNQDVVKLEAEIIELKEKNSYPSGDIGVNAFGEKPIFEDKGKMLRAILAIGQQDVSYSRLEPLDDKIAILGASSDHLILDVTGSDKKYKVGDIVEFKLDYGALLQLTTSPYVKKVYQ
jgi:predicted amino acid racemase